MDSYESKSIEELEQHFNTNIKKGLTENEAQNRLSKNGKNELPQGKITPWYIYFLKALIKPLQLILFVAAIISVVAPRIGSNSDPISITDFIDFMVIIFIIFFDAILETVQSVKARKSVDALKSLSKPKTVVIRNGKQKEIDASDLVVGDIVILEAGRYVPAELRLIETSKCMIDESILTGESLAVEKNSNKMVKTTKILAEMKNIAFMSTFITTGRAVGIVIKVGLETEIGKIAESIDKNAEQTTPLEKRLNLFSYLISIIAVVIGITMFVTMILSGKSALWANYLMVAITLAIGVIPESLAAVVSITLSSSTKRMVDENVIVKKLFSVETLGSVNVICTDKTGTLTKNKMTVQKVIINNQIVDSEKYVSFEMNHQKDLFLKSLVLPNDSTVENKDRIGDPTELALVDFAKLMNLNEQTAREKWKRIDEIPFDSKRKLMSSVNRIDGKNLTFTKGAIDQLLKICNKIFIGNKIIELTPKHKKEILKQVHELSNDALRILGFAYNDKYDDSDDIENDLIFLGAVGMIDPVRSEAVRAIAEANQAGINVVMITGDHAITALAIAKELDLAYSLHEVMSSEVLDKMGDKELLRVIDTIKVFARVNPEHKVRIVEALQKKKYIVSMTGDGVNDAPSLSKADIGVAMGITGTDVAKQAADVILTDDNFSTIMVGVNEGRNVYQKIRRAVVLLMGFNLANVLTIFILSLLIHMSPLEATNILYINLVVESFLAIAIGMGPLDSSLMLMPPKIGKNNLLKGIIWPIVKIGILTSIAGIISFYIGMRFTPDSLLTFNIDGNDQILSWRDALAYTNYSEDIVVYGRTSLFITTVFAATFFAHTIKLSNWKASSKINWAISKPLIYSSIFAMITNTIFIFTPKVNTNIFGLVGYGENGWNNQTGILILISFAFSLLPTALILTTDAITFYSYHLATRPWERNREIIHNMVEEDKKNISKK